MNARRILTIGLALLVGMTGPALLLEWAARPAAPGAETTPGDLPWPYCAPDAPGPSFAPLPDRHSRVDLFVGPVITPLADVLVQLRSSTVVAGVDEEGHPQRIADAPRLLASVVAGPVLFRSASAPERLEAASEGRRMMAGEAQLILQATEHLARGHEVVAGISGVWDDGTLSADFAVDATIGEILWGDTHPADETTYLLRFVRTSFPEASTGPALAELVVAWNREQEAPEGERPISEAWGRFLAETFGIGYRELHGIPEPGTRAWWDQAPPLCRSLADAPPEVLAGLEPVRVLVHVPRELPQPKDAVICLRLPLGTMPSCSVFRPNPDSEYLEFEAYTDGVHPLSVQIAHDTPRGISWVERVTVAEIPPELARAGTVLVRLDPALGGATYAEIAAGAGETASTVGRLGETEDPLAA